ncbi:SpoIIE family protein phosphatase [Marivirga arenosa]|uniref:SpoIIE family protein phosphatase n=1 Tax=Marivirga arenosa TaxID=3059076 RepID=A0AA51ZY13_9BACT|nr:SpoIIE family protein phosphatase [Marivirga sp. BKB1-2]WNB18839.1 SpoIIE family protein phosphatase [Marivirga sp. BKB1-2]
MKTSIPYITIFFYLFIIPFSSFSQIQKTEKFEVNDFLGERNFISATQADNLIIYFNTDKGILSYDGSDFKEVGIKNKSINALQVYQNQLFIATNNLLLLYSPKSDSLAEISTDAIVQFEIFNDELWMISKNSLFKWSDGNLNEIYTSNSDAFNTFKVSNNITIIGHSNGISLIEDNKEISSFGSFLKPTKIIEYDSSIYILSENAIFQLNDEKIVRDFSSNSAIMDFIIDDFGKTWFLNINKALRVNDLMNVNPAFYENGTKQITGNKLFNDKESNLWVLGQNNLTKISQNNAFSKLLIDDVLEIFTGETSNIIISNNQIIYYSALTGLRKIQINSSDKPLDNYHAFYNGEDWIITLNENIYKLSGDKRSLQLVKKDNLFYPTAYIDENTFLAKSQNNNLFTVNKDFEPISKIVNLSSVNNLIHTNNSIVAYSDNSINRLSYEGVMMNSIVFPDSIKINNIIPAKEGFWYHTLSDVFKVNYKGDFTKINIKTDLTTELRILNTFDDFENNLWISTPDKLLRFPVNPNKEESILENFTEYNKNDFLISTYFKSAKKDSTSLLWFTHDNGISIYNPLKEIPNLVPPSVSVKNAFAYELDNFNNPYDTTYFLENQEKISSNAIVIIEPSVISHFNCDKATIGYKNLSTSQAERRIRNGEKIILTDLNDGLNTINFIGYNSNGIESANQANINIYVIPPIWKRNWFYLTSIISVFLLGFVGYRTVISIKNNRARDLEEELHKGLEDLEKKSHLQVLKAERLKQLNELITSQKSELEKKNKQIESQKYELSLTNQQIKKQKDLLEETSSKLTSSINYAKRIQNALMSTEVEIKKAFEKSFVYFMPRDMVSGDFFWFNQVKNEKGEDLLILAAVDCTGHGVPGAIVSVVGMNLLNNITKLKKVYDPGQILTDMNHDIIHDLRQNETQVNDGMDMTLITYNKTTKQLYFAGAKNPLMYIEDNELIRIKGDKHAIGGQQRGDDRIFTTHQLDLTDGKERTFYLFSDGYQDQFGGEKGFKYLVGNFKKLLLRIHDKDVLDQKTILHEEIEEWKSGYPQTDDILVIGLKL